MVTVYTNLHSAVNKYLLNKDKVLMLKYKINSLSLDKMLQVLWILKLLKNVIMKTWSLSKMVKKEMKEIK